MRGCGVSRVWTSSLVVNGTFLHGLHALVLSACMQRSATGIFMMYKSD